MAVTSTASCALGIDVGGTKIAAALVSFPEGHVHARRVIPTRLERGGEAVLADVLTLARELATEGNRHRFTVECIGLGICELVDLSGNIASANCIAWRGLPIRERLSEIVPALIEADVRAAALAEALLGAGKSLRVFLYVTIGTGISSCLVLEGKPFVGARGATGTMASSPLPCLSGTTNGALTLEDIASGPGLVAQFNQHGRKAKSAQEVLAAAEAGDTEAMATVRSGAELLGASIAGLINMLDPQVVIIGGGLGLSAGIYRDTMIAAARRYIWSDLHRDLPIVPAALGIDAGIIGAAATAWKRFGEASQHGRGA